MIEDGMFLALGFFGAMLIAIACVPFLWARAMRLSRRRLELLVPLSTKEIEADRDSLRAEAAVTQRRLEQLIERRDLASADVAVELGRRTARLVSVEQTVETLRAERVSLIAEVAALRDLVRDGDGQRAALEKALHDADAQIENGLNNAREAAERYANLQSASDEQRAMIASLETARSGLELQLRDGESALARLEKLVLDLRSAAATLTRERDTARNEVLIATVQKNRIEIALKEEVARGQVRDRQVAAKVEALAAAEQRKMSKQDDVTISDEAMANLQRRFDALQAQILKEPAAETNDHSWPDPAARALRNAIVAAGDDALRLLGPGTNEPASGRAAVLNGKEA